MSDADHKARRVPMRVVEPRELPPVRIALPCDRCGEGVRTLSMYLSAKSTQMSGGQPGGYYSTCGIRICASCLHEGLALLEPGP